MASVSRVGAEAVAARDQLAAQLDVVVDLAVEDDPDALVFVGERLAPAGEIDDAESGGDRGRPGAQVIAVIVGAAVRDQLGHAEDLRAIDRGCLVHATGNAAHVLEGYGLRAPCRSPRKEIAASRRA